MTRRGRGSTGPGRPSSLPPDGYEAPPPVHEGPSGGLVVDFHGDDDRRASFDIGGLALPGWHPLLAQALAQRIGPSGMRTLSGAQSSWRSMRSWVKFLTTLNTPPTTPADLTRAHVNAFHARADMSHRSRYGDMTEMRLQLSAESVREHVPAEALDAFNRRMPRPRKNAVGGYSSGELDRLTAAARADTAAIARRIRANEDLIRRFESAPDQLGPEARSTAEELVAMASTGVVPGRADPGGVAERVQRASRLFLTWKDLAPLLVLLAIASERNGESIKELPTRHRVLEERAVEVVLVKRRRGTKRWFETVTWEIGPKGRELHTPGGLYLLLLELTARSRGFCGSTAAICFWRNGHRAGAQGPAEHWAPFEVALSRAASIDLSGWAAGRFRPLLSDPSPRAKKEDDKKSSGTKDTAEPDGPTTLEVTFNRIKTSVDARRTKQLGGHLPSSAKSNTAQVLFTNYLKPDEMTREWAEEVIGQAVADAEQAALDAHAAVIARRGAPTVIPDADQFEQVGLPAEKARELADGDLDTAWTACEDHDHHPETGTTCGDSFLDCFHCGNCLVTRAHLPKLLGLLNGLGALRQRMSEDDWWKRYGPAWVALRRDILAKFTPAEVDKVRQGPLPDALLDLVEAPWDQP